MHKLKYKVGDKVIVIGKVEYFDTVVGSVVTITGVQINETEWPYYIIADNEEMCCAEEEIELAVKPGKQLEFSFMKE